jgi:hypothetical protein
MRQHNFYILTLIAVFTAQAEDFADEVFLMENSVLNNGSASAISSSFYSPSRFLQYPADASEAPTMALEAMTLPLFGGLSQAISGAGSMQLQSALRVSAFTSIVSTSDIPVRPILPGTAEERQSNPALRPDSCLGCPSLRDRVYLGYFNILREYSGLLPRTGLESRPIPFSLSAGLTAKYFWEELEGGDFYAQNLNMDAGVGLRVLWGYDPVDKTSSQVLKVHFAGFEILPTRQRSDIGVHTAYESVDRRWHLSASFEQGLPFWNSKFALGAEQRSEGGVWPALGGEWCFADALALRGGWDGNFWATGFSVRYGWMALHYSLQYHDLGTSLYQVSLQIQHG